MRRRAFHIVVLLMLLGGGAIVNVAVAWGCRLWSPMSSNMPDLLTDRSASVVGKGCGVRIELKFVGSESRGSLVAGWPFFSVAMKHRTKLGVWTFESAITSSAVTAISDGKQGLPYRPIWPGFAINTIFYAAILWVVFFVPGKLKRTLRRGRGRCPACAYPIGTSPVCTECGKVLA